MIKKFLIVGKSQLHLVSSRADTSADKFYIAEILMPMETLWQVEAIIKEADYERSLNQESFQGKIGILHRKIFKAVHPFVVSEKDRLWISQRIQE